MKTPSVYLRSFVILTSALLVLCGSRNLAAGPATISGTGKGRGAINLIFSDPTHAQANLSLNGTATHVGKYKMVGSGFVEWNGTRFVQTSPALFTVTAHNGDELFGTFAYTLNWTPGRYELFGRAILTGGTGQYFGYAGHADFSTIVNGLTGEIDSATFTFLLQKTLIGKAFHGEGRAEGQTTITPPAEGILSGGVISIQSALKGNASHFGKVKLELTSAGRVVALTPTPVPPSTLIITTASGDTLFGTFKWLNRDLGFPKYEVYGPFTIIGGTGKMQNVTGRGTYRGVLDVLTGRNTDVTFDFDLIGSN